MEKQTTACSFFTNKYRLTTEMCGESELSRTDLGIMIGLILMVTLLCVAFPAFPDTIRAYFAEPSAGTILSLSGIAGITILPPVAALFALAMVFPKLVGEKRFQEQISFVPGENRTVDFYDQYVKIQGTFSKKLFYKDLKRTGQTRNLYLMFFRDRQMLIIPKSGFCKGSLKELKSFIKKHKTVGSRIYGILRYLPVLAYLLIMVFVLLAE